MDNESATMNDIPDIVKKTRMMSDDIGAINKALADYIVCESQTDIQIKEKKLNKAFRAKQIIINSLKEILNTIRAHY